MEDTVEVVQQAGYQMVCAACGKRKGKKGKRIP